MSRCQELPVRLIRSKETSGHHHMTARSRFMATASITQRREIEDAKDLEPT